MAALFDFIHVMCIYINIYIYCIAKQCVYVSLYLFIVAVLSCVRHCISTQWTEIHYMCLRSTRSDCCQVIMTDRIDSTQLQLDFCLGWLLCVGVLFCCIDYSSLYFCCCCSCIASIFCITIQWNPNNELTRFVGNITVMRRRCLCFVWCFLYGE